VDVHARFFKKRTVSRKFVLVPAVRADPITPGRQEVQQTLVCIIGL
jgi:hypothetical protein